MVDAMTVILLRRDHCHPYQLQNRAVAVNRFSWLIWLELRTLSDFAAIVLY